MEEPKPVNRKITYRLYPTHKQEAALLETKRLHQQLYNGALEERNARKGKSYYATGSKLYQVAQRQKWQCPICADKLFNGESIHIHHAKKVANGGDDEISNLQLLHTECHIHVHSGSARKCCGGLEPYDE